MILPTKHIKFTESLFGLGGYILKYIQINPKTVDEIWNKIRTLNKDKSFDAYHSFDSVILALNYLYLIGAIEIDKEEKLYNAIARTKG